jgi:hypothetical protein
MGVLDGSEKLQMRLESLDIVEQCLAIQHKWRKESCEYTLWMNIVPKFRRRYNLDWELPADAEDSLEGKALEEHVARMLEEQNK